jgi:hypothetical protein
MRRLGIVAIFAGLAFLSACGGGSGSNSQPTTNPTITTQVQVSSSATAQLSLAMSTSFQPAEWDDQFFVINPGATTPLGNLKSQHIRLQAISQGVPQTDANTWNFSVVDAITQPVLGVGDHSPEFQIAVAPAFMYDANHNFLDSTYQQFASYTQDLVSYYNKGGFSAPDGNHVSPSPYPITWWGIYNEPNINNLSAAQYVDLYNAVVPAMQAVDPSIKFAAVELADFSGQPQAYLPTFVSNVTAHVDVLATHFYSSCNQKDSDAQVLSTVPSFAADVSYIYQQAQTNPALATVPVWVTENNVNADFSDANGMSTCNPGQTFVADQRGSSAFFAAWRPYVFSQLGKVGAQALYHWDFDADAQYGEVDYNTANLQLSYWVDYWLARTFPASPGSSILQFTNSDDQNVEVLPVKNADASVTIMLSDHAVAAATDNNGKGTARDISVDVSALGSFTSASLLTIDTNTDVVNGPVATSMTPSAQIDINLGGYGVAFLTLK